MAIFCSDAPVLMGGTNQSLFMVVVADKVADLFAFKRRWDNNPWDLSPSERELWKSGSKEALHEFKDRIIEVNLTLPNKGLLMFKSKTQVRCLVKQKHCQFIYDQGYPFIPKQYVPVLNVMLRHEYSANSGRGITAEAEKFYEIELRGKVIELLRSKQWVDAPEHSDLQNLNARLEKIDLGRRKDLNWSSEQKDVTEVLTQKFTPRTLPKPVKKVSEPATEAPVEAPKTGDFWSSDYAKRNLS